MQRIIKSYILVFDIKSFLYINSDKSLTANLLNFEVGYMGSSVSTRTEHFKFDLIDISKSDGASPIEIILSVIRLKEFATKFCGFAI